MSLRLKCRIMCPFYYIGYAPPLTLQFLLILIFVDSYWPLMLTQWILLIDPFYSIKAITNHGIFWHYLTNYIISYRLVKLHDDNPHAYISKVLFILVQVTFYSLNLENSDWPFQDTKIWEIWSAIVEGTIEFLFLDWEPCLWHVLPWTTSTIVSTWAKQQCTAKCEITRRPL